MQIMQMQLLLAHLNMITIRKGQAPQLRSEPGIMNNNATRMKVWLLLLLHSGLSSAESARECPDQCRCSTYTVNCIHVQYSFVPTRNTSLDVEVMDLRFNKIRHIPPGSFRNLTRLNTLLLNNNKIRGLRNGAFEGLQNLQYLYLYSNSIKHMDDQVFQDVPNLEHLYLHHNNIKVISPTMFQNLASLNRLFLHQNYLTKIPSGTFVKLPKLERVRLDANPLNCDCQLNWLVDFMKSSKVQLAAVCASPEALSSKPIKTISKEDMLCNEAHFVEEPTDADVIPGGTIVFSCIAKLNDSILEDIQWTKEGQPVLPSSRVVIEKTSLMVSNAQQADIGVYQCHVNSISSRMARVRFYRGRAKPSIVHSPIHSEVEKGSTIILDCGASGFPRPTFAWYKDGGRLSTAHDRYKIEENGTLVISNAQLGDSGHYRCSASNYLGRASSAARVKVNLKLPESMPIITSKPRDAEVAEDTFVEFTCVARGHPYPDITWWNNNRLVDSNHRIHVSNGGQHLRIEDTKSYDSGVYTCRAQNRLGQEEFSATLKVNARPKPLELIDVPHDMVALKGTTIQMACRAKGSPEPKIKWLKNGHSMPSDDSRFYFRPDGSLIVQNVTEADEGNYECIAENGIEKKSATAKFQLRKARQAETQKSSINEIRYQTEKNSNPGDEYVLVALEEATIEVDKALNATVEELFMKSVSNSTPAELIRVFRFPPENIRGLAKAAEIYERTLEIVAEKVQAANEDWKAAKKFSYDDLLSTFNLELIANLSGCEAHRAQREVNCSQDLCFHGKYRTIDGTCNNFQNPLWGSSLTTFKRLLPSQYENNFNSPIGWDGDKLYNGFRLPSARLVSFEIISTSKITSDDEMSHMAMQWGQFLDHDLDHSMEAISRQTFDDGITCSATCLNRPPCFPIKIGPNDPRITNRECMEFTRSSAACGSGSTSVFFNQLQKREQLNQLTSFIDASQVYGSSLDLAISLRNLTNDYGRLREGLTFNYGHKPFLPFNTRHVIDCRRDPRESNIGCFLAGDVRANEQIGLIAMHTLWFREHNRLAGILRQLNPTWDGDKIFEESRKIVGAQMQHITYSHWLPMIIGQDGMEKLGNYLGYRADVDPSIANVFAASAFRFGHTLINPLLKRLNANFEAIPEGHLPLHQAFFAPWRVVQEGGIDPILRGLFASSAKKNLPNELMNDELTEKLFKAVHAVALDLGSLNIQRGRDHGIPAYSKWRQFCGLSPITSWNQLSQVIGSQTVVSKLQELYGHPGNIDLWVGGLLEPPVIGARVGPTIQCILINQFKRLRDGDRFWYENPAAFKPDQLSQIKQTSLARIVCDNADQIAQVYPNLFKIAGQELADCASIPELSLNPWFECQDSHLTSRPKRSAKDQEHSYLDDPSGERIEGIETALMKNKIQLRKMERRLSRVYKAMIKEHGNDEVCIDHNGSMRNDDDSWLHAQDGVCAKCYCKNSLIKCHKSTCDET